MMTSEFNCTSIETCFLMVHLLSMGGTRMLLSIQVTGCFFLLAPIAQKRPQSPHLFRLGPHHWHLAIKWGPKDVKPSPSLWQSIAPGINHLCTRRNAMVQVQNRNTHLPSNTVLTSGTIIRHDLPQRFEQGLKMRSLVSLVVKIGRTEDWSLSHRILFW